MSALPCPVVANPFAAADQAYAAITEFLRSKEAWQVEHSELERELEGKGRELLRKLLQAHLELRQPGKTVEAVRDAAGTPLEPTTVHERSVESIFGTVEVARTGYGAAGTASLHPLDGALNLPPEKYSLEVRRRAAIEAAKSSFDEGLQTLEMYTGAHVPKRQFEELMKRAAQDFKAFYAQRQAGARADPQTGSILVLTVDGKGVVMRPEDLREATQRAAAARARTFTARLGSGRRLHAKRMASVAAIYTVEPFVRTPEQILPESCRQETGPARPQPEHKRVWASLAQSPEDVIGEMFDEAARRVAAGMRRSATLREMGAERKPVDECADYLLHYSSYLQYDKALAEGVPIATGVIEGACRHLVEDRMNLTGARWSLTGAEAVLRLRALRSSNDFDAYWKFHERQEYERHHASRYADHRVPETVPPPTSSQRSRPGKLRLVSKKGKP